MPATPTLRERIVARFSDGELTTLCADHFPAVEREFTTGMTLSQRVLLLMEHCARNLLREPLLDALERARPGLCGADRPALLADLAALASTPAAAGQPQKIINATTNQQIGAVSGGLVLGNNIGGMVNYHAPPPLPPFGPLHQLRAPVPDFVGRAEELAAIVAALGQVADGSAYAISGLRGMGGIGKSELVFQAALHLAPHFPTPRSLLRCAVPPPTRSARRRRCNTSFAPFCPRRAFLIRLKSFSHSTARCSAASAC